MKAPISYPQSMWNEMILIHRQSRKPFGFEEPWVLWKTCLRQIAFGRADWQFEEHIETTDEIYQGEEAYRFCLEVVSGLHSRVLGETEVLGQFRELFLNQKFQPESWSQQLHRFTQAVLTDVKTVRQKHLMATGSQSYGSYARRLLKGFKQVDIIGSGQLVESMLPWLCKEDWKVRILCRDLAKAKSRFQSISERLKVVSLFKSAPLAEAVVIAAPLKSEQFKEFGVGFDQKLIIDYRDVSTTDSIAVANDGKLITLQDYFSEFQSTQNEVDLRVSAARLTIRELVARREAKLTQIRPFGWEDLCG